MEEEDVFRYFLEEIEQGATVTGTGETGAGLGITHG